MIWGAYIWFWAIIASGPPFLLVCWRIGVHRRRNHPMVLAAERWHELQNEDPADRRCRQVEDAYARGDIAPEDLDWCVLLALKPPEPMPSPPYPNLARFGVDTSTLTWTAADTHTIPWTAAGIPLDEGEPITLYDARGNVQTIVRRRSAPEPLPTEPDPRLVSYGEHLGHERPR